MSGSSLRLFSGGLGFPAAIGLLLLMDAGVPIPIPTDLLLLLIGVRAAAGDFPFWAAAAGLELVAVGGTAILFFAARGPASALIGRWGPRLGLTSARIGTISSAIERRGWRYLALGRATPGLRTLTVFGAALSRVSPRYALPPLAVGSSVFLQAHLVLGFVFGPLAEQAFSRARLPLIAGLGMLLLIGALIWVRRRGRASSAAQSWTEACCPACLTLALVNRRAE